MREYVVYYTCDGGGRGEAFTFAKDRADAMRFVKDTYRAKPVSARLLSRAKEVAPPVNRHTAEAGVAKLMQDAEAQVRANAHSGRAIGRFLRLKLSYAITDKEIRRACEWIVRQVEDRDATSGVIKR